jgi:hypothetical protein
MGARQFLLIYDFLIRAQFSILVIAWICSSQEPVPASTPHPHPRGRDHFRPPISFADTVLRAPS